MSVSKGNRTESHKNEWYRLASCLSHLHSSVHCHARPRFIGCSTALICTWFCLKRLKFQGSLVSSFIKHCPNCLFQCVPEDMPGRSHRNRDWIYSRRCPVKCLSAQCPVPTPGVVYRDISPEESFFSRSGESFWIQKPSSVDFHNQHPTNRQRVKLNICLDIRLALGRKNCRFPSKGLWSAVPFGELKFVWKFTAKTAYIRCAFAKRWPL